METPREILDSIPAAEVFVVAGCEEGVGCLGRQVAQLSSMHGIQGLVSQSSFCPFLTGNVFVSTGRVFDGGGKSN